MECRGTVPCVAVRSICWNIQVNQQEAHQVYKHSKENNGVPAKAVCSFAKDTKYYSTYKLNFKIKETIGNCEEWHSGPMKLIDHPSDQQFTVEHNRSRLRTVELLEIVYANLGE